VHGNHLNIPYLSVVNWPRHYKVRSSLFVTFLAVFITGMLRSHAAGNVDKSTVLNGLEVIDRLTWSGLSLTWNILSFHQSPAHVARQR
jgi:hypothetical protein